MNANYIKLYCEHCDTYHTLPATKVVTTADLRSDEYEFVATCPVHKTKQIYNRRRMR